MDPSEDLDLYFNEVQDLIRLRDFHKLSSKFLVELALFDCATVTRTVTSSGFPRGVIEVARQEKKELKKRKKRKRFDAAAQRIRQNEAWIVYGAQLSAMVAAAYAKDLLCRIAPNRLEVEKKIDDILSGLQEAAEEQRDIGKKDATYEWYKDRVEERVEDTCLWFLKHEHFQRWLKQDSGPLLVTADSGSGKSVLAKYQIDHGLRRSATICYFFFQDQDQNTVGQVLCALLHQLFSQKPSLIEHAMPQFRKDGQCLVNSTESLWKSIHDLDLEDDEDFKTRFISWFGLFVSIHQGNIYFIHQTARQLLLADLATPTTVPSEMHRHRSISIRQAHTVLAELCVSYLNFFNSDVSLPTDDNGKAGHPVDSHAFIDYSAENWGDHFHEASIIDDATIVPSAAKICNPDSKSYSTWFGIYRNATGMNGTIAEHFTDLMVASHFGWNAVVKQVLENGADVEAKDKRGRTPLVRAIEGQHVAIVKRLLEAGTKVDYHYKLVSESDQCGVDDNGDDD
ncbi:ankyrin repeat domain-containing protein [Fusarium globosum]|uniref:Ankyrin repeat domain-containing protein n=1 Tax=Fusarium globosum TaxID=78864 RepID=A0A8H6D5H0_9HYPO|nr:ankyrin repeat domain-containing protein [Fusarium globosum]